uniref:Uncharacterized protein n=1 Tax=Bactrocera dorsalis TaxID=27457 RepID=A0A034WNT2_BACDO
MNKNNAYYAAGLVIHFCYCNAKISYVLFTQFQLFSPHTSRVAKHCNIAACNKLMHTTLTDVASNNVATLQTMLAANKQIHCSLPFTFAMVFIVVNCCCCCLVCGFCTLCCRSGVAPTYSDNEKWL